MTTVYFIYHLYQTGNVGSHNIKRIEEQPKEGFITSEEAEKYIANSIRNKNQWIFTQEQYHFTILKVYTTYGNNIRGSTIPVEGGRAENLGQHKAGRKWMPLPLFFKPSC